MDSLSLCPAKVVNWLWLATSPLHDEPYCGIEWCVGTVWKALVCEEVPFSGVGHALSTLMLADQGNRDNRIGLRSARCELDEADALACRSSGASCQAEAERDGQCVTFAQRLEIRDPIEAHRSRNLRGS